MADPARNISLFIAFRVLFNARFYYPVIGILFLDLGLSVEQYSLLNVVWAAAIVTLEVPSGALADQIGRKRMVVIACVLMVVEMVLMAFAPTSHPGWLFAALVLNRILSGAAEASASGADEALAYDSLKAAGRDGEWPAVLSRLMRWQSAAFFAAMLVGAAVYDDALLRAVLGAVGVEAPWLTREITVRFPVYLTLINAVAALFVALAMRDVEHVAEPGGSAARRVTLASTLRQTLAAGAWILSSPKALAVLLAGLCFDSIMRLFLTFNANYFRAIQLPEASFGILGSVFALLGLAAAPLARRLAERRGAAFNFGVVAALGFVGLAGAAFAVPYIGLWVSVPIGIAWSCLAFFLSHYLNEIVPPDKRATVLSFRGLALNLGYGAIGLMFAGLTRWLSERPDAPKSEDAIFVQALQWLPGYFVAATVLLAVTVRGLTRRRSAG